ncbi:MAG: TolC family protein, partial [Sphaerochaetaceae bacterium]|nr:TolC family protein [Sphaerochaetaceae bacterium]
YAPDVSILASLSYGGSRFPFIENGWSSADDWNAFVGVNIKGTFFDGTKQYAEEKKTRAGQEKARLEMEKNVREIINTVKETRRSLNVTLSSIDYKETELKQKQELKRIAYEKYEARQITRIEYLKASLEEHVKQAEVYKEYIKLSTLYYTLSMLTQ